MESLRTCVIKNRLRWFITQRLDNRLLNTLLIAKDIERYARTSVMDWKRLENNPPESLGISSVDICNAKCCFCAYRYYSPSRTTMDLKTTKKILDQFCEVGGKSVDFNSLVGEPLLDPRLYERIKLAVDKRLRVLLFTNGILLNKDENVSRLLRSGMDTLFISIDGFDRDTYRQIFGVDKYYEVLSGVRKLITKNREMGGPISVKLAIRSGEPASKIFATEDFQNYIKPYLDLCNIGIARAMDNWGD